MKKASKILAVIIAVITITCLMAITASAVTYNVTVGGTSSLPKGPENDYGPAVNEYTLSDPTLAKIVDSDTIQFLKPGTLTVTNNWKLWDGRNPIPRKGTITRTYEIKYPAPIQDTTIKLESGEFCGGRAFPDFSVGVNKLYEVTEATFYKEMADYYVGDTLPHYKAGTVVNYVRVTLKPSVGQFFAFVGHEDGKTYESTVYTIEYNGKKYTPYVKNSYAENELWVYLDVTFSEGAFYTVTVKDLDAPYHNGPLDKEVTCDSALEVVSVKYTMFGKELDAFSKGDNIGITVRLKSGDGKNTFNPEGRAYWKEQGVYSIETKLISSTEAEYTFTYKVDAIDSQIIKWADFTMPGVFTGEPLPTNAFSATDGIVVKSVTWTPNDAKADANKEYTVKIEFGKKDEFVYADDFAEQGVVSINGERAKFVNETSSGGGVKGKFETKKYYAEATFKPTVVVNAGTTGTTTETVTGTVNGTYVSGTVVSGTTTPEFRIDITYNNKEVTAEKGEKVILDFTHNMDLMLCSNINYQWYKAEGPVYGTGEMVEGGHEKQLEAHTYEVGTDYYYCIMTCKFDDSEYTSDFSESPIVKVTVTESTAKDFKVFPVGETEIVTKDGDFTLKLGVEGQGKQDVTYVWRPCNEDGSFDAEDYKYYVIGETDTLNYYINVNEVNVPHYFLGAASIYGGDGSVIFKVTYVPEYEEDDEEYPEEKFNLVADGKQEIIIYSWEEKVTLKAKVTGTEKLADFQWFRCDKEGKTIGAPLSMGDSVTVGPIPKEDMMTPYYYRCTAMIGNTAKSIIFEVLLAPKGVEEEYVFPFTDVKETDWFYDAVAGANQMGLINGKSATIYAPEDNMTYAEAVKLAVCMNILYNGGNPAEDIKNGTDVWFSTYMTYALDNGIIDEDLTPKADENITRKEYAYIFSKALPAEAFAEKNEIPSGSIPDVKEEKLAQDKAIYTFYRAGILAGVDVKGTFKPSDNIKRSEVAAILIRMMDPSARVSAPKELGK